MKDEDIISQYCLKCDLYGKEFHYLSTKMHDCVTHYSLLRRDLDDESITMKYKRK